MIKSHSQVVISQHQLNNVINQMLSQVGENRYIDLKINTIPFTYNQIDNGTYTSITNRFIVTVIFKEI